MRICHLKQNMLSRSCGTYLIIRQNMQAVISHTGFEYHPGRDGTSIMDNVNIGCVRSCRENVFPE